MTAAGWIEIALYIAILTVITPLLGGYMTRVYRGEIRIGIVERAIVALGGDREQDWKAYAKSVLILSAVFFGLLYLILQLEDYALLAGAIVGFVALAIVMFVTLRVDWSGVSAREVRV